MSKSDIHYGTLKGGKLSAPSFMDALRQLDGPVQLTVQRLQGGRSSQANRYYHGVVVDLIYRALRQGGMEITRQGTHELLKYRFLREDHPIGEDGEYVTTVKSTTALDKEEFGAYLERCIQFASEYLNTVIPPPGEQVSMDIAA